MPTKISQLAEYNLLTASAFIPIVDNNETVGDKNKKISIADLRKVFYLNSRNTSSFIRHTPGLYYFGDNSDGAGNFSGSITTLRTRISASFASTQDGPPVIKNFSSLFISRSVVISPTNRCRGMLIFVDGDATISGSISMTARGAKFTGSDASFTTINPPYLGDYWSTQLFPSSSYLSRVFAVGASGGPAGTTPNGTGVVGTTGTLGRSGGGGGGGAAPTGGAGSAGTSFSGGSGGGGGGPSPGANGIAFGGQGGPVLGYGGGGAGNPGGVTPAAAPFSPLPVSAPSGTGGLLILIVRGNLKIGPNGSINANGSNGGNSLVGFGSAGGGASGGGVLYIYYGGTLTNNGTITSNGGTGGTADAPSTAVGGAGGAGTSIIQKLNTAFPAAN
jgi:hypothetical protein